MQKLSKLVYLPLFVISLSTGLLSACASDGGTSNIAPIVNLASDTSRPADDVARDINRKPQAMLEFANVRPGQKVVDLMAGGGYFTRVFSVAVGQNGQVYAVTAQFYIDLLTARNRPLPASVKGEAGRQNVIDAIANENGLNVPSNVDLVWTSQNYHDVHLFDSAQGVEKLNRAAFMVLKSGGYYVVLDHSGTAGLDAAGMRRLHRIDEAQVIREVEAVGFKLDAKSDALRNADDDRSKNVFDPSLRGHTDQFILRFKKP